LKRGDVTHLQRRWRSDLPEVHHRPPEEHGNEIIGEEMIEGRQDAMAVTDDLRSTYATRLSAGGVADEWVTQLLRQGDAQVFKRCSQVKLQMKREALQKLNRTANEGGVLRQVG
jgi:hypothetical protein